MRSRCKSESVDVAIIGGGIAGLSASACISRAGLSVALIEGRDRLGGRIHTLVGRSLPVPLELGAEFIHGKPSQIWDIVRENSLPASEVAGDHICRTRSGLKRCNDFWDDWEYVSKRMQLKGRQDEAFQSFVDRLSRGRHSRKFLKRATEYVEGFNAADASEISLRALIQDRDASEKIDASRPFHLLRGYHGLLPYFEAQLPKHRSTHLSTIVKEIYWSSGRVLVKAIDATSKESRHFEAKAAVITLPLGVLQSTSLRFIPDIPAKIKVARSLRMGKVVKAILVFRDAFWMDHGFDNLRFVHTNGQPFPLFWAASPVRTPILTGWAAGPAGEALAGRTQEQILDASLQSLAAAFELPIQQLRRWLEGHFVPDWQGDPFSLGAYSYTPVGSVSARQRLAKSINNTLFFAGEATHTEGFASTIHGAIDTGARAAAEVVAGIKSGRRVA